MQDYLFVCFTTAGLLAFVLFTLGFFLIVNGSRKDGALLEISVVIYLLLPILMTYLYVGRQVAGHPSSILVFAALMILIPIVAFRVAPMLWEPIALVALKLHLSAAGIKSPHKN